MTPQAFSPTGVRFHQIDKKYGGLYALRRVSFEAAPGECMVLAGRNGSGKTTLLRIAAQLVRPTAGQVSFPPSAHGKEISTGFVAHATMVYDELTAEENLLLFARLQGMRDGQKRVATLLEAVGLSERRDSRVRTFSRGMRQRVAIARALLQEPALLLLDEPATGLDPQGARWLAETLQRLHGNGCTVLLSLHGESELSSLASRAIRLDAGAIVADTQNGTSLHTILSV